MKAAVFDRCGNPAEVLQVRDLPAPLPKHGQVLVRMLASPINPSDLLYVQGRYGKRPALPAVPGFEGVGVVEASGGGLIGKFRKGRRVAVLNGQGGNWQEQVVVPARQVVPIPSGIPDEQAASFFVNPASALIMVRQVLRVPSGSWLLQTAAGSALGRMVCRLAQLDGFRTINVVRRREQAEELRRLGEAAVICSADESIEERVAALTDGKGASFVLDAVGGAMGSAAARSMAPGGRMIVYGTLSDEPLTIDPRTLMVGAKRIEGFWLSEWTRSQSVLTMLRLFRQIGQLMTSGTLVSEHAEVIALSEIQAAVRKAAEPGRHGKILIRLGQT